MASHLSRHLRFMPPASLPAWLGRWFTRAAPPLALWGKLPTHADYLHHHAGAQAARAWQAWLERHGAPRQRQRPSAWLQLAPSAADLRSVPVAFVLPPGTLAFAPRALVAGVMADSRDAAGRLHPLLAWRCVDSCWLAAQAGRPGLPWWHALAQLLERWALLYEAAQEGTTRVAFEWPRLCGLAAELDAAPPEHPAALHAWLQQQCPGPVAETGEAEPPLLPTSHHLHGVRHLPWPAWPDGEQPASRCAAFWQQDGEGRIVAVESTLAGLLRPGRRAA